MNDSEFGGMNYASNIFEAICLTLTHYVATKETFYVLF